MESEFPSIPFRSNEIVPIQSALMVLEGGERAEQKMPEAHPKMVLYISIFYFFDLLFCQVMGTSTPPCLTIVESIS